MTTYEFRIVLDGEYELSEDIADELFAAGCSDGLPGTCDGVFAIDFHREGPSLEAAIRSAVADVERASCRVARVEIERLPMVGPA